MAAKQRIIKAKDRTKNSNGIQTESCENKKMNFDVYRIGIRVVMIFMIIIVVYYSRESTLVTFASTKEEFTKKSAAVECSKDYYKELEKFPGCTPVKCGRVVFDGVVSPNEAAAMLDIAKRGFMHGGSHGGASILDLHSGALSHGSSFINIYKLKDGKRVFNEQDFKIYSFVKNKIKTDVASHFKVKDTSLYLTHPTFFSRITSAPAVTVHDEYWHPHVDKETYQSFHYTSLLYLSTYGEDFSGGRFVFVDQETNKTVEPKFGRVSAFTSGTENVHFVENVSSGIRYAITVSFTCDPDHAIEDPMGMNT